MSVLYDQNQSSGYSWGAHPSGTRMYHSQKRRGELLARRDIQPDDLAEVASQMRRYESEFDGIVERVRGIYLFNNETEILRFFRGHRRVPSLLVEAGPHLHKFFRDTIFQLKASVDEENWEMLYVYAQWSGSAEDALSALDAFDEEWWLANSFPVGANLTFTYRIV